MKKIIYSLVIMIAAGSLFTSCIEPVEPAGIYDLREAKARYYDALSKLRAADAVKVEAEADLIKAQAEMKRAKVEYQNLLNEEQRLLNEATALGNEKDAAKWAMKLEELQKEHELNMIDYERKIAQAQEALRQALSQIAMAGLDLTTAEKNALNNAITAYEKALKDVQDAQEAVTAAEAALWAFDYEMSNMYDDEFIFTESYGDYIRTGMDYKTYLETCVAYYELYAAYFAAMYDEMATNTDLAKWAEELEDLKADLTEAKYNRYQVTKDSVEYMMNVYHDGVHGYEMAVDAWVKDHPAVAKPTAPTAPKESDYPAADYLADTITFPTVKVPAGDAAFDKLVSMLSGYMLADSPVSGASPANKVMFKDGEGQLIIVANQDMKDFILGTETATDLEYKYKDKDGNPKTISAQYGLNGALSTLKRALVLSHSTATKEDAEKVAKEKLAIWTADRDSIILLYKAKAAKKSVAEAYAPLATAMKALKDAKTEATSESGSLVKAAETLAETLNGMVNHADISRADSLKLVEAFVDFAKTRAAYLDYTPYKNGTEFDNKDLFYFSSSVTPTHIVDSIPFKDLTIALIDKTPAYEYRPDKSQITTAKVAAFQNIAEQLFGATSNIALAIKNFGASNPNYPVAATDLNTAGLYGAYKYVAGTPAKITNADDSEYTPKEVTDAIAAVNAAATELNNLWKRFWAENLGATVDAKGNVTIPALQDKYNPEVYTMDVFTNPYNVIVVDGGKIKWTANLGAILGSVDPNKAKNDGSDFNAGGYVTGAAIFAGSLGNTDFFNWAVANDEWINFDSTESLEKIEKWIGEVVAAFEKDAADAEAKAKKAYEKAVANYDKAKATYDANKAKYDAYQAALAAFVGYKEDGKTLRPITTTIGAPDANYQAAGVKQTETGIYQWTGVWDLAGEQAELAEKYLPGYPEKLAKWHTDAVAIDHQIIHLEAIVKELEDAYITASGILYDETDYIEWYGFNVEEYFEDFLDYLNTMYERCLAYISMYEDAIAEYEAGYSAAQIQREILVHQLEYAEAKLADAEIKLQVAEETYQKVLAAILG